MVLSRIIYFGFYCSVIIGIAGSALPANNISVPGQYSTIQSAINVAAAGDSIIVTDKGTYHEDLAVNKKLGLISSPIGATIDGQITTSSSPTDLYIRGFNLAPAAAGKYGINISDSAKVRIYSCTVRAGVTGIFIGGTPPTLIVQDCNFVHCGVDGISVNNSATSVTITRCKFVDNGRCGVYGHYVTTGLSFSMQDSLFDGNPTGFRLEGGSSQIDRCKFVNGLITPSEDDNDVNKKYQGYIVINGETLGAYSNNIFNCLLIGSRNPVKLFGMSAFDMRHCTIVDPCNVMHSAVRCYADSGSSLYCNVRNSIIDGADYGITSNGAGDLRFGGTRYNLWNCSVKNFNGTGVDVAAYSGILNRSPGFINAQAGDYHLSDTSDCIGTGDPVVATSTDFELKSRTMPANTYPDLGCFEEQCTVLKLKTSDTVMVLTLEGHDMYDNTDKLVQSLASSCQAHINKSGPRVYVIWPKSLYNNTDSAYTWLNYDIQKFNLQTQYVGIPQLLSEASKVVSQYVLFDDAQYVNKIGAAVTTIAGAENLIMVGPNEESLAQAYGFSRKYDRRTTWDNQSYYDIYNGIWQTYRNVVSTKRLSVYDGLDPSGNDWYINEKMLCLNLSSNANTYPQECGLLSSIYDAYAMSAWVITATVEPPRDGNPSVLTAIKGHAFLYPGQKNVSFHKWMVPSKLPKIPPMPQLPTINPNKTYISVSVSEGDGLWTLFGGYMGKYAGSRQLTVPIGWSMTPALIYCAPDIYSYYMDNARASDVFVCAWGIGYGGPHLMSDAGLRAYIRESLIYAKKGNFQIANSLEDVDMTNPADTAITPLSKINIIFEEFGSQIWGITNGYGGITYGSQYEGPEYYSTLNDHIWLNNRLFPYTGAGYDADEEPLAMKNTIESIAAAQKKPNEPLFLPGWPILFPENLTQNLETLEGMLDPSRFEIVRIDQLLAMKQKWNNPGHPSVSPLIAQWQITPHTTSCYGISMTAAAPVCPTNSEYYFVCTQGPGHDSGWQDSPVYQDVNLPPQSHLAYKVIFREKSARWNTSGYSAVRSVDTSYAGDLDGNNTVNLIDLAEFGKFWLCQTAPYTGGDLDGDGFVGFGDLHMLLSNWLIQSNIPADVQLANFDNYATDGWFFGCGAPSYYDDGGNDAMVSQSTNTFDEGTGSVKFSYISAPSYIPFPWNNRIRKNFSTPIDMSFANAALSIKVKGSKTSSARLSAIYIGDVNGNSAYLELSTSTSDSWTTVIAMIANFIPWDGALDYSKIRTIDVMTSCYPDTAPAYDVYIDDLRLAAGNP